LDKDAQYWINHLALSPHPEGGYYRATYNSGLTIARSALPSSYQGDRSASTAIYFLLDRENFSAFHRIASDELWHFYAGAPLLVHVIGESGEYSRIPLGSDPEAGEELQAVVKAGCWFASHLRDSHLRETTSFALVGCTVAPGFDFEDFELAKGKEMARRYPKHRQLIEKLTRD